jgi:hypothetical protein
MEFKDLAAMLLERGNAMQTFWGFYITIAFGLLAVLAGLKSKEHLKTAATVLSVAFVLFAYANYSGMHDVAEQRAFLYRELQSVSSSATTDTNLVSGFLKVTAPPRPSSVTLFHAVFDGVEVVAIWLLVGFRLRSVAEMPRRVLEWMMAFIGFGQRRAEQRTNTIPNPPS